MKVNRKQLPLSERFPCSVREVKDILAEQLDYASWGWPSKSYAFDMRCFHRPAITGTVVASASVTRQRETSLRLFAVSRNDFTDLESERFTSQILPKLRRWLVTQRNKPETAVLGVEECVVEQTARGYRMHMLRYL